MRTLKKALSLVLVLAMVLSLGVSAFAVEKAADYSDYADVKNTEAVDVLTAIGVLNGNDDGTFGPEGNFTRAAAAKIICYMTLGKTIADALPVGATQFNDVPATHWAAKYIQYCANQGIIGGNGDGTFAPEGTLTATAWAKMLLCALGYDASVEGLTGTGWEINVTKLAMSEDVKIATAEDLTSTFNRDAAAKFAFNTLKAKVVDKYSGTGTTITIGDTTINTSAGTPVLGGTFMAKHFPKLAISTTAKNDAMGRPATVWTLNGETVSTAPSAPVLTLTSAIDQKGLDKALKEAGNYTLAATVSRTINAATYSAAANKSSEYLLTGTPAWAGNGNVVEMYDTNDDKVIDTVIVIQPTFAEVAVKAVAATKTRGAYTQYSVGGVEIGRVYTSVVDADKDKSTASVAGTVADKDKVLYYKSSNTTYISAVETVSGVLSSITSAGVYTIDGTAYKLSAAVNASAPSILKDSQTFYVDSYGYVLAAKSAGTTDQYALVLSTEKFSALKDGKVVDTYTATIVGVDGKVETVETVDAVDADGKAKDFTGLKEQVVTVSTGVNGTVLAATDKEVSISAITKGTSTLAINLYANASTLFVFANYNTKGEVTGTVTTYTGIANVPTYGTLTKAYALDTNADKIADVVYVYDNVSATSSDSYVYVIGTYTTTSAGNAWDVIKNGEPATITLRAADKLDAHTLYASITVTGTTLGTAKKATSGTPDSVVANKGGLLFVGDTLVSEKYTDSTPVYVIDTADDAVTTTTFADLSSTVAGTVYKVVDSTNLLAVYVVYNSAA